MKSSRARRDKPDRFTNPLDISDPVAEGIWHAIQPLDRVARETEDRWGVNRLPELVTPETAQRFGQAKAKLDAAIDANDADEVARRAAVMMRGWAALVKEATELGHKPLQADAWMFTLTDGTQAALARTTADARKIAADQGGVRVYSLDEVSRIVSMLDAQGVGAVKQLFPGAEVTAVRKKIEQPPEEWWDHGDEVPF